uniref:Uncharacterized protein n=1 Tax=Cacopsylla melanoneura TaxID=428564 RepID=A0A8D8SUK9_9HEMI
MNHNAETDRDREENVKQDNEKSIEEIRGTSGNDRTAINEDEGKIVQVGISCEIERETLTRTTPMKQVRKSCRLSHSTISMEHATEITPFDQTKDTIPENEAVTSKNEEISDEKVLLQTKNVTKILDRMSKVTKIQDRISQMKNKSPSSESSPELKNQTKLDKQDDDSVNTSKSKTMEKTPEDKKIKSTSSRSEHKHPATPPYSTKKIYEYFSCSENKVRHDVNETRSKFNTNSKMYTETNRDRTNMSTISGIKRALSPSKFNEGMANKKRRTETPDKQSLMKMKTRHGKSSISMATAYDSSLRKIYEFFSVQQTTLNPTVHVTPSTDNATKTVIIGSTSTSQKTGNMFSEEATTAQPQKIQQISTKNAEMMKEIDNMGTIACDVSMYAESDSSQSNHSNNNSVVRTSRRLITKQVDVKPRGRVLRRQSVVNYFPEDMMTSSSSDESSSPPNSTKVLAQRSRSTKVLAQTSRAVDLSDSESQSGNSRPKRSSSRHVNSPHLEFEIKSSPKSVSCFKKKLIASAPSQGAVDKSIRGNIESRLLRRRDNSVKDENFSPNKNREHSRALGNNEEDQQGAQAAKRVSRRLSMARKDLSLLM